MALFFNSVLLETGTWMMLVFFILFTYFQTKWTYWKKRGVPQMKPSFPFGNFSDVFLLRKGIGFLFQDIYNSLKGEKFGGTYMFTNPGIMFRDPELIKACLVKDFNHFHDHGFYDDSEREPLLGHLMFLNGQKWRNLRAKLSPTFTSGKMKMMFPLLAETAFELLECLEKPASEGETVEMKDIIARFSTDIISSCAFGIKCNCLKNPEAEFRQWGKKVFMLTFEGIIYAITTSMAPSLIPLLPIKVIDPQISKYFREMVRNSVNYRETNNITRNDFMQLLIQLKNKGFVNVNRMREEINECEDKPKKLSMDELAAQAFVFFIGGFETSSATITFCMYELCRNPDIQRQVQEEIDTVLAKHNGQLTYEGINEMEYLDKVVSETLRKYPPVQVLNREVTMQYRIPGTDVVLEKGTPVVIPILGLQHDPEYFPDPCRFDPERFNEEEKAKRPAFTYLPFGEGPRICIAMRFGMMQTKTGLAAVLSRYNLEMSEKTPVPLVLDPKSFLLSPVGGMWLKIKNRKRA